MPIITIPLRKTLPLGLGPALQSQLFFVSPEILAFTLVEQNARIQAVTVTTASEGDHGLPAKINFLVESELVKQKVFKSKVVWQSPPPAGEPGYQTGMFETLVAKGLAFEAAEGQVGFAEPLIELL